MLCSLPDACSYTKKIVKRSLAHEGKYDELVTYLKSADSSKAADRRPTRVGVPQRATLNRAKRIIRNHNNGSLPEVRNRSRLIAVAAGLDPRARLTVDGRRAVK